MRNLEKIVDPSVNEADHQEREDVLEEDTERSVAARWDWGWTVRWAVRSYPSLCCLLTALPLPSLQSSMQTLVLVSRTSYSWDKFSLTPCKMWESVYTVQSWCCASYHLAQSGGNLKTRHVTIQTGQTGGSRSPPAAAGWPAWTWWRLDWPAGRRWPAAGAGTGRRPADPPAVRGAVSRVNIN